MGKIWSLLYLTPSPLPADEIAIRTGLSAGAVSMSLAELQQWGLVDRAVNTEDRRRHFRAETDVWGIVRRIFRERELRLVGRAKAQFQSAYDLLADGPDQDEETRFAMARLRSLIELASLGYTLLEGFAAVGQLSLDPIRGALAFARDRS